MADAVSLWIPLGGQIAVLVAFSFLSSWVRELMT